MVTIGTVVKANIHEFFMQSRLEVCYMHFTDARKQLIFDIDEYSWQELLTAIKDKQPFVYLENLQKYITLENIHYVELVKKSVKSN